MKNKALKNIVFCLILLSSMNGIAQPGINDDSGNLESTGADQAAAPINDYLLPMLLIGINLGFSLLKKNTKIAK